MNFDIAAVNAVWRFSYYKLSPSSILQIKELFQQLSATIAGLAAIDEKLPRGSADWRGLLLLLRPIDLLLCRRPEKKAPSPGMANRRDGSRQG